MLFVVMLGGKHPAAKIEVHDVVFALGENLSDCYPQLRSNWFGQANGLHIDSWMAVDGVSGYRLEWSNQAPAANELRLFFINLGGYQPEQFGEEHRYVLVVAKDIAGAKALGKQQMMQVWDKPHTDSILDVDDCIPIDHVAGRYVRLVRGFYQNTVQQNDYILL